MSFLAMHFSKSKRMRRFMFCFLIFFIFLLIFLPIKDINGDDVGYLEGFIKRGYLAESLIRYNGWSSRTIIDTSIMFFVQHFTLWKICNAVILFLTVYLLTKMIFDENIEKIFFIAALYCLVPLQLFDETGWVATSLNYQWPFAFALLAFLPLANALKGKNNKLSTYILAFGGSIFALNQEQINACFLILSLVILFFLFRKKNFSYFLCAPTFISLLNLVYFLFSPGNKMRIQSEIIHWFPKFSKLSFFSKVDLGVSSFGQPLFFGFNILFFFLFLLILIAGYQKGFSEGRLFVLSTPFVANLVFSFFKISTDAFQNFGGKDNAFNLRTDYFLRLFRPNGTHFEWNDLSTWLPLTAIVLLFIFLIVGIYLVSPTPQIGFFLSIILIMGACSRIIMGFSPTVWASGLRTYYVMFMVGVILTAFLLKFLRLMNAKLASLMEAVIMAFGFTAVILFSSYITHINLTS
ncbi:MAG: DUF6056 family protein [Enterococcaceae bacterium]|jgi:hypothetical protein|nr:DUF6056 family protein [Enterococcaceae bacterium]